MIAAPSIEEIVITFIRAQLHPGVEVDVDPEANLFTSGLIDSVGAMRMIAHIEEVLQVKIPPTALIPANFRTIRVMADYLASLKSA